MRILFISLLFLLSLFLSNLAVSSEKRELLVGTISKGEWEIYLLTENSTKKGEVIILNCLRKPSPEKKKALEKELIALEKEYKEVAKEMNLKIDFDKRRKIYLDSLSYEETCEINCKNREIIVILTGGNVIMRVSLLLNPNGQKVLKDFCQQ